MVRLLWVEEDAAVDSERAVVGGCRIVRRPRGDEPVSCIVFLFYITCFGKVKIGTRFTREETISSISTALMLSSDLGYACVSADFIS